MGGYPLPSIRWIKVSGVSKEEKDIGTALESGDAGQAGVSSELYVRVTDSDNAAAYKCSVMNEAVTSPLTATVLLFPVYFMSPNLRISPPDTVQVKSEEGIESETVLLCESDECHPSCNLTWFLNGYAIDRSLTTIRESSSVGEHAGQKSRSRLQLVKAWTSNEDGNTVTCASSNNFLPNKRFSKNITVQVLCKLLCPMTPDSIARTTVAPAPDPDSSFVSHLLSFPGRFPCLDKPEFRSSNKSTAFDVMEGEVEFRTSFPATGNPNQIHYFWSKNGLILTNGQRIQLNGPTMVMRDISRDDHGSYTVRASNVQGSTKAFFNLNVLCE